ncbi:MAG TPA: ribonuclease P protein component [Tepidisphaeraceae bacterium]|nr:ribonuclease P protein component [Tepidisphaeraceae bacterium]
MPDKRLTRPASRRLSGRRTFSAIFERGIKETRGPLRLIAQSNTLGYLRTGLVLPRAVGIAVRRNRIKRLLRESLRLLQYDLPPGYDLVVVVRPHAPLALADYMKLISTGMEKLHRKFQEQ